MNGLKISNRIIEFDYLRSFAIIAVIVIHALSYFEEIREINSMVITILIIHRISNFAVPLFVFISGFVLCTKYNNLFSQKTFYKKRAESILPPYIIFSLIYLILLFNTTWLNESQKLHSVNIIFRILTGSISYLWFISLISQLYILYPYLMKIYIKIANKNKINIFLIILILVQDIWLIIKSLLVSSLDLNLGFNVEYKIILNYLFISHIFYFVLGIHVYQNYSQIRNWILKSKLGLYIAFNMSSIFIVSFWIAGIIQSGNYDNIPKYYIVVPYILFPLYNSLIFSILIIFSIYLSNIHNIHTHIFYLIGKYSYGIYLIHGIFINIIVNLVYPKVNIEYTQWGFYPILFIFTLVSSFLSVRLLSYLPWSKLIIGTER